MKTLTSKWAFVLPTIFLIISLYGSFIYTPPEQIGGCSIGNIFCGAQLPPLHLFYLPGAIILALLGGSAGIPLNADGHFYVILMNIIIYYLFNVLIIWTGNQKFEINKK